MDDIDLTSYLKREISNRRELVTSTLTDGLLKDMEHYKNLQGQLEMLNFIEMSISDFYKENKF